MDYSAALTKATTFLRGHRNECSDQFRHFPSLQRGIDESCLLILGEKKTSARTLNAVGHDSESREK